MCLEKDIKDFLRYYKKPELKATSYDTLYRTAENYVFPFLGLRETKKVTAFEVIDLLELLKKKYSMSTVKKVYGLLKMFYTFAVEQRIVNKNIIQSISCKDPNQNIRPKVKAFTIDEVQKFQRAALEKDTDGKYISYYGPLLVLYLHTGCRLGELLALESEPDYDYEQQKICIHSDVETIGAFDDNGNRVKGCRIIKQMSPKSKNSNRDIYLNNISEMCLRYYYLRSLRSNSKALIPSAKHVQKFASPSSVQSAFYNICRHAGITPSGGVHVLRHSYATHLIKNKEDIKVVSRMLGHKSIKVTLDTYYHLFEDEVTKANTVLDRVFAF